MPHDAMVAAGYIAWVSEDEGRRLERLPDSDELVDIPAMYVGEGQHQQYVPARRQAPVGRALHSYLSLANPGAGKLTAETLTSMKIPGKDVPGLGWHIHPDALTEAQYKQWSTPADREQASNIKRLFTEGRVTRGFIPSTVTKERRNFTDAWEAVARNRLHDNHARRRITAGPAEAWALADQGGLPLERSAAKGRLSIAASALSTEQARRMNNAAFIGELYTKDLLSPGHIVSESVYRHRFPAGWEWVQQALLRMRSLTSSGSASATEGERRALIDNGRIMLVSRKNRSGGTVWKIATGVPRESVETILERIERLSAAQAPYESQGARSS
ncbi:hypothetical protein [Streptomyces sp. NPDC059850]|uniref:hypothetical protein n=1 Tax=Streptomyces sp. NPDC059850 TaxID=3346970 RepID=UPI0036561963